MKKIKIQTFEPKLTTLLTRACSEFELNAADRKCDYILKYPVHCRNTSSATSIMARRYKPPTKEHKKNNVCPNYEYIFKFHNGYTKFIELISQATHCLKCATKR